MGGGACCLVKKNFKKTLILAFDEVLSVVMQPLIIQYSHIWLLHYFSMFSLPIDMSAVLFFRSEYELLMCSSSRRHGGVVKICWLS